jgi:protein tyrosine phosphatase
MLRNASIKRMNRDIRVEELNRYTDILPFEDTRVVLQKGEGADGYINANFVHSPLGLDKKIIAA